jgi:hypothetical protein
LSAASRANAAAPGRPPISLVIVVAVAENGVIGSANAMP